MKKKITPEKLSHYILYGLLTLTALVFMAYFLAGSVEPSGTDALTEEATATPKLLDLLLWFIYILIILTAGTVVGTMLRTLFIRKGR